MPRKQKYPVTVFSFAPSLSHLLTFCGVYIQRLSFLVKKKDNLIQLKLA